MNSPVRLLLRLLATIIITWALTVLMDSYLIITGGFIGVVLVGGILAVLNVIVRPILKAIAFPIHLIMGLLALLLVNIGFLWIAEEIVGKVSPSIASMQIEGGWVGWIAVAFALSITNWIVAAMLDERD